MSFTGRLIDLPLRHRDQPPLDGVDTPRSAVSRGIGDTFKEQGVQSSLSRVDPRLKNGCRGVTLEVGRGGPAA